MPTLTVSLLGEPRVRGPDGPVACTAKKALGLFCYLALSGTRQPRRELAQLFWGGGNPEGARASLRTALLRLPAPMADALSADRDSIGVTPVIELDTARFAALAQSDTIDDLDQAAALYGGELLKGLEVDATAEFDDWLARERARWRQAAQSLFDKLIERHRERARLDSARAAIERDAAIATARRWCELEPAAEAAHRWLIRLYVEAGRPDAAITQYESCRRELAVAAGRPPSAQTRALIESLQHDAQPAAVGSPPTPRADTSPVTIPGLPGTVFFGRLEELASLEQLLFDPDCRLLTVHAMGGMGKTRLASVLVNQVAGRFTHGVTWVALEDVPSAEQLPLALARALNIDLPAQAEPVAALAAALRAQHRLLVLDNFEHLMTAPGGSGADAVDCVLGLLRDARTLRILVTSREALGVQEEWLYDLRGLPFPSGDGAAAQPGAFAATELFAQRARQAYAGFSAQAEWPHIVRLCTLVEGLPLALELAAAWVRTVPCGDLVAAIETEARALASRHRNRPQRHRNLDAVVRTSWSLLQREQQRALVPLAAFAGGFTQEAAATVADAPLRVLSALVDKSLVHRRADGRLGLHELVRQFLHQQALRDADGLRAVQRRHAAFFAALLERCRIELDGPQGLEVNATLTREWPNLMAAAERWQVETEGAAVVEAWLRVLSARSWHVHLRPFADRMLAPDVALPVAVRAMALVHRATAHVFFNDSDQADADLAAAIELARAHGLHDALAAALVQAAAVGFIRDDVALVAQRLAEAEPVLQAVADVGVRVRASYLAGLLLEAQGRLTEAAQHLRQTVATARALQSSEQWIATVQSLLGLLLVRIGELDEAQATLRDAIAFFERSGHVGFQARSRNALAVGLLAQDDEAAIEAAAAEATRSLALFEQIGHAHGQSTAADTLGQALWALGRLDEARVLFERAAAIDSPVIADDALLHLGLLCLQRGELAKAVRLARERIEAAFEHDLDTIRRSATLLASAIVLSVDAGSASSRRWLQQLLAERDLDWELRRRAQRMLATAGAPAAQSGTAASLHADDLRAMRDALARIA